MVGRRGEAPLVPPYILPNFKMALALSWLCGRLKSLYEIMDIADGFAEWFGLSPSQLTRNWASSANAALHRLFTRV